MSKAGFSRQDKKEGNAVSDRMKYGIKSVAVRSENLLTTVKASNGNTFQGNGSTQVIFDIPAMSGGYYLDSASSRFSFKLSLMGSTISANSEVALDRGVQSIIGRWQLYDASGHLLEDFQNYHLLYAMNEICTGNPVTRGFRGSFFGESRGGIAGDPTCGRVIAGGFARTSEYVPYIHATHGPIISMDNQATELFPMTCTFFSSLFGGGQDKYFPMSAMNGFRLVLTLNTPEIAFTANDGLVDLVYHIEDPTIHMNMIRVDPAVDRGIINQWKGTDGRLRIHSQSWRTYSVTVVAPETTKNVVIPISVSSMKALFFTFSSPTPTQTMPASAFYHRNVIDYQVFIGSVAIPTTPVRIGFDTKYEIRSFSDAIAETLRAWHVRLQDADYPTLLREDYDYLQKKHVDGGYTSNMVYGVELESFSNKSDVIESGINVLNNNIEVRLNMSSVAADGEDNTMVMTFYALHDVFLVIDPETGITTLEF